MTTQSVLADPVGIVDVFLRRIDDSCSTLAVDGVRPEWQASCQGFGYPLLGNTEWSQLEAKVYPNIILKAGNSKLFQPRTKTWNIWISEDIKMIRILKILIIRRGRLSWGVFLFIVFTIAAVYYTIVSSGACNISHYGKRTMYIFM